MQPLFDGALHGLQFKNPPIPIIKKIKGINQQPPFKQLLLFLELLHMLSKHTEVEKLSSITFANKNQQNNQDKITQVTKFLLENLHRTITLEEISNYCNLSPPSFCRWFKIAVGNSFVTYLNTARIERACQQLLQTKQRISEIAYNNGFESVGHFNRVFKKIKGNTPSGYRQEAYRGITNICEKVGGRNFDDQNHT